MWFQTCLQQQLTAFLCYVTVVSPCTKIGKVRFYLVPEYVTANFPNGESDIGTVVGCTIHYPEWTNGAVNTAEEALSKFATGITVVATSKTPARRHATEGLLGK